MSYSNTCFHSVSLRSALPESLTLACIVVLTSLLQIPPAMAQSQLVLEEVIVTARKREENLQETPLSVSAFSLEKLSRDGIINMAGFNKIIPNIEVQNGNGQSRVANVYIRGVGQRNTEPNLDSGVAIYLDGVYVARMDGALLDINDVASVQVLRGPQGTLFGKNVTGGALVYSTNKPVNEFEGKALLRVGNYGKLDGQLVLNVPLIEDELFSRLSLSSVTRDGYIHNALDGLDYTDDDRMAAVFQLRWQPGDNLTADLNLNYAKTDELGRPGDCALVPGVQGWQATLQDGLVEGATGLTIGGHCQANADLGKYTVNSDFQNAYFAENKGASLTLDWALSDRLSVKSITAWKAVDSYSASDIDSSGVALVSRTGDTGYAPDAHPAENTQFSQEFQLTGSAFGERLTYVAGLYHFQEKTENSVTWGVSGGPFFAANLGADDLYLGRNNGTGLDAEHDSQAAFVQADWAFNQAWKMTLGLRYTQEERELLRTSYTSIVETYSTDPAIPAVDASFIAEGLFFLPAGRADLLNRFPRIEPVSEIFGETDNDDITPMASLQYLFSGEGFINQGTAYLTYSEGFRSGGLSESPGGALEVFRPETVKNIELGLKFDAWDSRLRANFALFNSDYDDRQLTTIVVNPDTGGISGRTINAEKSTIRGIEAEITLLPIDNLELSLNLAVNDGEIKEYSDVQLDLFDITGPIDTNQCPGFIDTGLRTRPPAAPQGVRQCNIDRSDENLPRLPDSTIFFAAQYYFKTDIGTFIPRVSYGRKDNVDACFDRGSCVSGLMVDDHIDFSARLTWMGPNERWRVAVWGNNLTDEDFNVGGTALTDFTGTAGRTSAVPRMYGADVEFSW